MEIYIIGMGNISPQVSFKNELLTDDPVEYRENLLTVIDPGYKNYIDPKSARRMSKVIKMGVSAAKICLEDSGVKMPDAILTGTGLGCIEDTENFLTEIIKNKEQLLTPTSFIQSTHNTVAAQIALMIKCHALNLTYVHRGFSFELALQESVMQLQEETAQYVLAGAVDELTANTFVILNRLGLIKRKPISNYSLFKDKQKGTVFGEGASFFLLSHLPGNKNYALLKRVEMLYKPRSEEQVNGFVKQVVEKAGLTIDDIDLVVGGMDGDPVNDEIYACMQKGILNKTNWIGFKHLCGEYHTASSFALWMTSLIIKKQHIPESLFIRKGERKQIKYALIYNHFLGNNHSAYVLQAC